MAENSNKILVALDGTPKAFHTIDYLCSFKPFLKRQVVLHNVITRVPYCYYDFKKNPSSKVAESGVAAWTEEYTAHMTSFMAESKTRMVHAGFKPESIQIIISERNRGIARDILDEAQKGYYALMIRRRGGADALLPIAMGSVSTKLMEKARSFPVILAGTRKMMHSLFIAVDGSDGAKRAVEFVAQTAGESNCRIVLCSVLRDFDRIGGVKDPDNSDMVKEAFEQIEAAMDDACDRLEMQGILKRNITIKIIQGAKSRAAELLETARAENCDTIVVGRRGTSDVSEFDMGGIPWKIIHGDRKMTVWVVP